MSSSRVGYSPLTNEENKRHASDQTRLQPNAIALTEKMQRKDMTFRIRGVQLEWGQDRLESFLAEQDTAAGPVVRSLVRETHGRSLSATVTFQCIPRPLRDLPTGRTWDIAVRTRPGSRPECVSLDTGFLGTTTLFAPPDEDHKVE